MAIFPAQGDVSTKNVWGTLLRNFFTLTFDLATGYFKDPWIDARSYATLALADAAAIAAGKPILVASNITVSTATTIISPVKVEYGGMFTKSGSGTLAFNGSFDAGLYQVFSGFSAGNITFGSNSVKEAFPEWAGIGNDGVVNAISIQIINNALLGPLGVDSVTRTSYGVVKFQATTYRIDSQLTFNGVPWVGSGIDSTFLDFYVGATYALNAATGSTANRIPLRIEDLTIFGNNSNTTAEGIALGHNYRSFGAFKSVRISGFGGSGVVFLYDIWNFSAYDLIVDSCGNDGSGKPGIRVDAGVNDLNGFDWYALELESNGKAGMSTGGGMDLPNTIIRNWKFHGGLWEGNFGRAEANFNGGDVQLFGVYTESTANATYALAFTSTTATIIGCRIAADPGHGSSGILFQGASFGLVSGNVHDTDFGTQVTVEDTSRVVLGGGNINMTFAITHPTTASVLAIDYSSGLWLSSPGPRIMITDGQSGGKQWEVSVGQSSPGTALLFRNRTDGTYAGIAENGSILLPTGTKIYSGTAAPIAGTWGVGDRVFNSVPSVGQPKSWVCTVAGTPGTWVSEGNL